LKRRSDQGGSEAKQTKVMVLHIEDRSAACIARSHLVWHAVVKQDEDATNIEHQADDAENGGHAWFSKIRVYI
jgi:hypothetical protein